MLSMRAIVWVIMALAGMACTPLQPPKAEIGRSALAGSAATSANQILITFEDERNDRPPIAESVSGYRQREDYGNSTWSLRVAEALAEDYGLHPVTQWPINALGIHCVVYEVPANQSMEQVMQRLGQDKRIEAVQAMKTFHVMAENYSDPYFKLQTGIRAMHIELAHQVATGRNVKIAIIDTGVDGKHPDLAGQVVAEQDFVDKSTDHGNDIHGTAVAGVIAASANNQLGIVGIAPNAKLFALKACWQLGDQKSDAECNSLTLALALNAAISLKPDIINLSLTGPQDALVARLVTKALNDGIIVVASAPSAATLEKDFPASINQVIAVRTAKSDKDSIVSTMTSVPAPGQEILTTLPHATYNFMSGSSFAAAHVSGLIALLLELNPKLDATQILALLHASIDRPHASDDQSLKTVDACAMMASAGKLADCFVPAAKPTPSVLATPAT